MVVMAGVLSGRRHGTGHPRTRLQAVGRLASRTVGRQQRGAAHEGYLIRRDTKRNLQLVLDHLIMVKLEVAGHEARLGDADE